MRVAGTLFWMGYTIILARTLSREDFALTLYVVNFSMIAVLIVTLGRDVALLRLASQAWEVGAHSAVRQMLAKSRKAVLLASVLLTAVLLGAWATGLDTPVTASPEIALLSGLITLAGAQMGLNRDTLRSVGKVWQSQVGFNFIRTIVPATGAIALYFLVEMSAELALIVFLVALGLSVLVEEVILRRLSWQDDLSAPQPDQAELMRAGLQLWPGNIANAVQMRIGGLVAGLALAPEIAALFLAAERIANLAQFPIAAAGQAGAPRVAQAASRSMRDTQIELGKAGLLMFLGALVGCFGAALVAWPALWALGTEYLAALPLTLILVCAHLSWAVFGFGQNALNLTGHHHVYRNVAVTASLAGACIMSLVAAEYGSLAMAWAYCGMWWATNLGFVLALYMNTRLQTGLFAVRYAKMRWLFAKPGGDKEQA